MPRTRSEVSGRPEPRRGPGSSALALGGFGAMLVAAAIVRTAVSRLTVDGLVLVAAGMVLAFAGLLRGTSGAVRGSRRGSRAAISGAGLAVVALAVGLVWIVAFVLTALTGPPADTGSGLVGPVPACVADVCPGPF